MRSMRGIYVHVPFCLSKCAYCGFNSCPNPSGVPDEYVMALARDAESEARSWSESRFNSIYFGGGTPSLLRPPQTERLLETIRRNYKVSEGSEITFECNPDTVTLGDLAALRDLGVTRISIGVQSIDDAELHLLGRTHSGRQAVAALGMANQAGFGSVSADVMIGIPGQTDRTYTATLDAAADHVSHLSAYMLSLEPGTRLAREVEDGEIEIPSDQRTIDLYMRTSEVLSAKGLRRYEISNWALPGHRCLHNMVYWHRGDYVGLGAGAHSHRSGLRYWRVSDPVAYVRRLAEGKGVIEMEEHLTRRQVLTEQVMLGLRISEGLDLGRIGVWGDAGGVDCATTLANLIETGHLIKHGNTVCLSDEGIAVCDAIVDVIVTSLCTDPLVSNKA